MRATVKLERGIGKLGCNNMRNIRKKMETRRSKTEKRSIEYALIVEKKKRQMKEVQRGR